jgi:hypothetical protein
MRQPFYDGVGGIPFPLRHIPESDRHGGFFKNDHRYLIKLLQLVLYKLYLVVIVLANGL